jgi:hypothetical protein
MSLVIQQTSHIKSNRIEINGERIFDDPAADDLKSLLTKAYRKLKINYPKFFKMDEISKLGFIGAELLMQAITTPYKAEEVGIVLSNNQSTLVTDSRFQESINDYEHFYPSPAVFVYTLPNIMMGEISIRHKLRGENAFFIFDRFNAGVLTDYINGLYAKGKLRYCIGGWVDQSASDYEAFLYWAEPLSKENVGVEHNPLELNKLYRQATIREDG